MDLDCTLAPVGGVYPSGVEERARLPLREGAPFCATAVEEIGVVDPDDQRHERVDATRFFVRAQTSHFGERGHGDPVERGKAARRLERSRCSASTKPAKRRSMHTMRSTASFTRRSAVPRTTTSWRSRRLQFARGSTRSAVAVALGDRAHHRVKAARRMRAHMLNAASALDSYIAHQDALHIQPAKT